jgi:hypothetical protein
MIWPHNWQNPQKTDHYWNTVSYTAVQCSLTQMVLPSTMESHSDPYLLFDMCVVLQLWMQVDRGGGVWCWNEVGLWPCSAVASVFILANSNSLPCQRQGCVNANSKDLNFTNKLHVCGC